MSRFRIPTRVAPSPAGEEPGLQNAAARLRSSRAAQARLLAELREDGTADVPEGLDPQPMVRLAYQDEIPGKKEEEPEGARHGRPLAKPATRIAKVKLVMLYRLPALLEAEVAAIAGRDSVTMEYVLRAMARDGRRNLRQLSSDTDVAPLTAEITALQALASGNRIVGDPMTVYVRPAALEAMHRAVGDPWRVLPRATVVGSYFTAIVARLIRARRAG